MDYTVKEDIKIIEFVIQGNCIEGEQLETIQKKYDELKELEVYQDFTCRILIEPFPQYTMPYIPYQPPYYNTPIVTTSP